LDRRAKNRVSVPNASYWEALQAAQRTASTPRTAPSWSLDHRLIAIDSGSSAAPMKTITFAVCGVSRGKENPQPTSLDEAAAGIIAIRKMLVNGNYTKQ
jgi:hypothetical protein